MGKARTLVTLALGAALAIGIPRVYNNIRDYLNTPRIEGIEENKIFVYDHDSTAMSAIFESDGKSICDEYSGQTKGITKPNCFAISIPPEMRKKGRFNFYAQDPEGHKTETRTYERTEGWESHGGVEKNE
jgi:hypothetical protein